MNGTLFPGRQKLPSQPVFLNVPTSVVRGTCVTSNWHRPVHVSRTEPNWGSVQRIKCDEAHCIRKNLCIYTAVGAVQVEGF